MCLCSFFLRETVKRERKKPHMQQHSPFEMMHCFLNNFVRGHEKCNFFLQFREGALSLLSYWLLFSPLSLTVPLRRFWLKMCWAEKEGKIEKRHSSFSSSVLFDLNLFLEFHLQPAFLLFFLEEANSSRWHEQIFLLLISDC